MRRTSDLAAQGLDSVALIISGRKQGAALALGLGTVPIHPTTSESRRACHLEEPKLVLIFRCPDSNAAFSSVNLRDGHFCGWASPGVNEEILTAPFPKSETDPRTLMACIHMRAVYQHAL